MLDQEHTKRPASVLVVLGRSTTISTNTHIHVCTCVSEYVVQVNRNRHWQTNISLQREMSDVGRITATTTTK